MFLGAGVDPETGAGKHLPSQGGRPEEEGAESWVETGWLWRKVRSCPRAGLQGPGSPDGSERWALEGASEERKEALSLLLWLESQRAAGTVSLPKAFNFFRTCGLSWETELLFLRDSFTRQALLASARHYGSRVGKKKIICKILMPSGSLCSSGRDRRSRHS